MAPAAILPPSPAGSAAPDEEDVVAGWTAFALFIALIIAVALLGMSLTKRLKNVERAAAEGKYDPSTPRRRSAGPVRGLAAAREMRERAAAEDDEPRDRSER